MHDEATAEFEQKQFKSVPYGHTARTLKMAINLYPQRQQQQLNVLLVLLLTDTLNIRRV